MAESGASLSRPVLPLLDCRPPMIVRVAPERGAYAAGPVVVRATLRGEDW